LCNNRDPHSDGAVSDSSVLAVLRHPSERCSPGTPGAPVLDNNDGTQATSERILTNKAKELKMELKGIYPAMVTPLTPDEQVDKAGMRNVVR
jgi:hypothetical protein